MAEKVEVIEQDLVETRLLKILMMCVKLFWTNAYLMQEQATQHGKKKMAHIVLLNRYTSHEDYISMHTWQKAIVK